MKTPITPPEYVHIGANISQHLRSGHRQGQAAFNALHEVRPDIAEEIRCAGNPCDPFYRDDRLEAFWDFVIAYGNEQPETTMVPVTFNGEDADDHITLGRFMQCIDDGVFTKYDGFAVFATATHYDPASRVGDGNTIPEWATHVVWFNK